MVDEYLSEHEQGEQVKQWIRENWAWVAAGVVIGLGGLSGWQYYQRYKVAQAEAASVLVNQYAAAAVTDKAKAESLLNNLTENYADTPYVYQGLMLQAQYSVETNDLDKAEAALRKVSAQRQDPQLAQVATLRLARVLIEQNKSDEALKLLDVDKAGAFAAGVHEVRGDALYAKQDLVGARSEYEAALKAYQAEGSADTSLLQLKLQDVGGSVAAATDVAATKAE